MLEIQTQRLTLVPMAPLHVENVHQMSVDPEVRRYLWEGQIIPVTQVEQMLKASEQCFTELGSGFYVMHINMPNDPNHGAFVGFCGHRYFDHKADGQESGPDSATEDQITDVELLFGMAPKFWGRGYGQEAAIAVLQHGFNTCGFTRVVAATDTPNQRSVQVLQKLGMSFIERRAWRGLDTVFYAMSAAEFKDR